MQSTTEEFVKFLGKGAYGSVDLVKYTKPDGSSFEAAVKSSYPKDYEVINKEFKILSDLKEYPYIVKCHGDKLELGFNQLDHEIYKFGLEYASQGSLHSFMGNYLGRKLPQSMIKNFTRMILKGLVSIHDHEYVHCDLKTDNLLVFTSEDDSSYEVKISDFGNCLEVGKVPSSWDGFDFPFLGTPNYMPPESFEYGVPNKTLDLWSLGCVVLEMFTGQIPWPRLHQDHIYQIVLIEGKAPEIPEYVPCDAREFIETCFAKNPEERGTAAELLFHRFVFRQELNVKVLRSKRVAKRSIDTTERQIKRQKVKIMPNTLILV